MDKEKLNWRSFADQGAINAKWNARHADATTSSIPRA